jgi:recombination protein RecR
MSSLPSSLERLIKEFTRLPGIGRKTAQRLSFHILKRPREEVVMFAKSLVEVKDSIHFCRVCFNFAENQLCSICSNLNRNENIVCVVEQASDIMILEKSLKFNGKYHVLGGLLSPLSRIGPEDIHIKELLSRINNNVSEVIVALNTSVEGETTTLYITKILKPLGTRVSRLAQGLPAGSELEFADELTLARALEGRVDIS